LFWTGSFCIGSGKDQFLFLNFFHPLFHLLLLYLHSTTIIVLVWDDLKRRVARLARRRPGAPRREPDGDAKRPGDVVLADPPAPLPGVDLGF